MNFNTPTLTHTHTALRLWPTQPWTLLLERVPLSLLAPHISSLFTTHHNHAISTTTFFLCLTHQPVCVMPSFSHFMFIYYYVNVLPLGVFILPHQLFHLMIFNSCELSPSLALPYSCLLQTLYIIHCNVKESLFLPHHTPVQYDVFIFS